MKIGDIFGRLTIISDPDKKYRVLAKCECGKIKDYYVYSITGGDATSCGCYRKERIIESKTTHGLTKHPLYRIWNKIKERCYCKTANSYSDYGGRGVTVCFEWLNDFKIFYQWAISNGWKPGLQIDKDIIPKKMGIPTNLYSAEMCCFVTSLENNRHQRTTKLTQDIANEIRGLYSTNNFSQKELGKIYHIRQSYVSEIVSNRSWPQDDYTPPKRNPRKQRPPVEDSMMNICRINNVGYNSVIKRMRRGQTFETALQALKTGIND